MFKRLGIVAGVAFVFALFTALPAGALNYSNGYIVITNATPGVIHVSTIVEEWGISKQETIFFNSCCYAAGTSYHVTARLSTRLNTVTTWVTPRLCSKNATPYGYAHLVVHYQQIERVDRSCP